MIFLYDLPFGRNPFRFIIENARLIGRCSMNIIYICFPFRTSGRAGGIVMTDLQQYDHPSVIGMTDVSE